METNKDLLLTIARDVAEIKKQITSLRINEAKIAATVALIVALVTGLLFNELSDKPARASEQNLRPDYHVQGAPTPGVPDSRERQARPEGARR